MKTKFKECMAKLYPEPKGVSDQQLLDLLRTFFMGYTEGLRDYYDSGERDVLHFIGHTMRENIYMSDVGWKPDESWKWW